MCVPHGTVEPESEQDGDLTRAQPRRITFQRFTTECICKMRPSASIKSPLQGSESYRARYRPLPPPPLPPRSLPPPQKQQQQQQQQQQLQSPSQSPSQPQRRFSNRKPLPPPPPLPPKRDSRNVEMIRLGERQSNNSTNPFDLEEGEISESDNSRPVSENIDEDELPLPDIDNKPIIRTKEENKIIRFLVSKRVYKYPGCSDSWCSNYCSYIANNHPFLSMIFVHYLHPFGRRQRLMVFLNGLFFAIFISFVIFETTLIPKLATCREGCNKQPRIQSDGSQNGFYCDGGYNNGVDYETYDKVCYFYHPWELAAISGGLIVLYQSVLEFVATCSCIQGRQYCICRSWQCNFFRRGVEFCGGGILFFFTVISTALLIWSLVACYVWGASFRLFGDIIVSKLWSVLEWFVWSFPFFSYRFPIDKRAHLEKLAKKAGLKTRDTGEDRFARSRSLLKAASDTMQLFAG